MHDIVLTQTPPEPVGVAAAPLRSRRRAARLQLGLASAVLVVVALAALAGDAVAPFDPLAISLSDTFLPPSATHLFGTDPLGRDVLSRAIAGARVSLFIAACAVLLAGCVGTALGVAAGYSGGVVDAAVMRLADMQLAFPAIILALVLSGAIGVNLFNLVLVLTMANWARFARVIRGEVLSLKSRDFVLLARLAGASPPWIMLRHLFPNIAGTFVVLATLDVGSVIILESTLSFLGLGIQPPTPSWGSMIADGRGHLSGAWWVCVAPGGVLIATVLAANLLGDALRDRLNTSVPESW